MFSVTGRYMVVETKSSQEDRTGALGQGYERLLTMGKGPLSQYFFNWSHFASIYCCRTRSPDGLSMAHKLSWKKIIGPVKCEEKARLKTDTFSSWKHQVKGYKKSFQTDFVIMRVGNCVEKWALSYTMEIFLKDTRRYVLKVSKFFIPCIPVASSRRWLKGERTWREKDWLWNPWSFHLTGGCQKEHMGSCAQGPGTNGWRQ